MSSYSQYHNIQNLSSEVRSAQACGGSDDNSRSYAPTIRSIVQSMCWGEGGEVFLFFSLIYPLSSRNFIIGKCCLPPDTPVNLWLIMIKGATSKSYDRVDDPSVWSRWGAGGGSLEGQFPLLQQNAGHNTPGHHHHLQLQSIGGGRSHAPRAAVPMCNVISR